MKPPEAPGIAPALPRSAQLAGQVTDRATEQDTPTPQASSNTSLPRKFLDLFASLKLTVVLLLLSIGLIFFGTLAQTTAGIWQVMETYFRSFYVAVPLGLFVPGNVGADIPGVLPWPGGATLGILLFINLIVAHAVRYTMVASGKRLGVGLLVTAIGVAAIAVAFFVPAVSHELVSHGVVPLFAVGTLFFIPLLIGAWLLYGKRYGIVLIHSSLILLLAGEFVTAITAKEGQMPIYTGQSLNWVQDIRVAELAVMVPAIGEHAVEGIAPTLSDELRHTVALGEYKLERLGESNEPFALAGLPGGFANLAVRVEQFMPNATLFRRSPRTTVPPQATVGLGLAEVYVQPAPEVSGVGEMRVDQPAAIVSVVNAQTGESYARVLTAVGLEPPDEPYRPIHQTVSTPMGDVEIAMRFERTYLPYAMGLGEFRHDLYPGTQVPKNFSSDVVIANEAGEIERAALIRMNEPLRFAGKTFFQSGWIPGPQNIAGTDRGTVLQVVNNPGWTVPYIACIVGGLGLTVHFAMGLLAYLRRRRTESAIKTKPVQTDDAGQLTAGKANPWPVWLATVVALVIAGGMLMPRDPVSNITDRGMDVSGFANVAVSYDGRFKPWDAVARDTLASIAGREKVERDGQAIHPVAWLLDAVTQPEARNDEVFRIDHPEVKRLIGVTNFERKRFSYAEIEPHLGELSRLSEAASEVDDKDRDPFQRAVIELGSHVAMYQGIVSLSAPHAVALPGAVDGQKTGEHWVSLPEVVGAIAEQGEVSQMPVDAVLLGAAIKAYDDGDAPGFASGVSALRSSQHERFPSLKGKAEMETAFNGFAPFGRTAGLYVVAGIAVALSWMFAPGPLRRFALVMLLVALVVHTVALGVRVHLSGRPPVTNLYGSAVFVGWGVVILGILLEPIAKLGLGYVTAAIAGVTTLLVARGLDDGDTMAVLQAVLDTNFWLATHVIVITLGYSAMFVAALIGAVYLLAGVYTTALKKAKDRRAIEASIFGVICFGLLLSFVGTILGGIWADQSWGRFWGWDPKENGAMMIVLWGAVVIHARLAKMIGGPGLASLSVLGAVITLWSWFGTNMLGVGLHSYGFMDSAVMWMLIAVTILSAVASIALIPTRRWASFA
ncbi:MAG: cytochrome c biogenesis protein CcsA [Planctomycetota bacterium]